MGKNKTGQYIGNIDSIILLCFIGYGLVSQYFFLSVLAGISFIIILRKLWKPYYPPVLLFFLLFNWLQVFASILYADFMGESLEKLFESDDLTFLFVMTFLQIILSALILNIYLVNRKRLVITKVQLEQAAAKLNTKNIIIGYFATILILPTLNSFAIGNASLYQLILSFGIFKSLFAGLLVFVLLLKKTNNRKLIIGILIFDFVMSFASFFSDFKLLLIMILIIYFTVQPYLKTKSVLRMVPIVALIIVFFSFWSYVKGGYREHLNKGSSQQMIAISDVEALSYIYQRVTDINLSSLQEGAAIFLSRVQYMERYSEVYHRVPSVIEHTGGSDLVKTIEFILVPRVINENKGVKDASERTSYYTGKNFSRAAQGTSISMGYFCDLYIDFGLYFMIIPLLLIVSLIGIIYTRILNVPKYNILFTYSILIGTFLTFGTFESDSVFFLGILRNSIAFLVLGYFVFFPVLHKFILNKN